MLGLSVVLLQILSCLGLGALVLRLAGVDEELSVGERYSWSFAIGFGFVGWLLFFVGIGGAISHVSLLIVLAAPLPAIALLRPLIISRSMSEEFAGAGWLVPGAVALVIAMDVLEVPAPVTDADTIAYHFDLPRRFWEAGGIFFVPRALDGAAPLLVQMTYLAPYAVGGETGLNLWVMMSGLAASLLVYTTCRRYLTPIWSLGITVVFATTPAVVYGAGSGQVEVRLALFAIVAAIAAGEALIKNKPGFAVIAGLSAGFFVGGKYFGLMFALATGVMLLFRSGLVKRGALYGLAVIFAGFQWYWWNWLHTGDPVFPMLYSLLHDHGAGYWTEDHRRVLLDWLAKYDRPAPVNLFWFFAYPFVATLKGYQAFESTRTGLGPFILLILPAALAGAVCFRKRLRLGPLAVAGLVTILTYALWFFLASSQRVRYLLPIYPLLLVVVSVAAVRCGEKFSLIRPIAAALVLTCLVQGLGQAVFTLRYAKYLLTSQSREAFYSRGVGRYSVVKWVNEHVRRDAVIMTPYRDMVFLLEPQVFQAHPFNQAIVNVLPDNADVHRFMQQIRSAGVTHAMVDPAALSGYEASYSKLMSAAISARCFAVIAEVKAVARASRTLPGLGSTAGTIQIVRRTDDSCQL